MDNDKEVLNDIELGNVTEEALEEALHLLAHLERASKLRFVELLGKLFAAYKLWDVAKMDYFYNEIDEEERVTVTFVGGHSIEVNVNADSLEAIVKDVVKNIEYWR